MRIANHSILVACLCLANQVISQSNVGVNNTNPDPSAALDVASTDKGFLMSRLATAQREAITSPAEGLTVYDLDTHSFWFWNGTAWEEVDLKTGWGLTGDDATTDQFVGTWVSWDTNFLVNNQGAGVLESSSGGQNTLFGTNTDLIAGNKNTCFGHGAGAGLSGNENLFMGKNAGANVTGNGNIGIGTYSAPEHSGSYNIHIGHEAGMRTDSVYMYPTDNIYIGKSAGRGSGGNETVIIGYGSETGLSNGSIVIGAEANLGFESNNTIAIGNETGISTTPGASDELKNCIFIGHGAGSGGETNLENAIALGAFSQVTQNHSLVLGHIPASGDFFGVGINTSVPNAHLEVNGYTKLGNESDVPAIKMMEYLDTLSNVAGTWTVVAHGLDVQKILDVDILADGSQGKVEAGDQSTGNLFSYYITAAGVHVTPVTGNSANVLGAPFTVLIVYEE